MRDASVGLSSNDHLLNCTVTLPKGELGFTSSVAACSAVIVSVFIESGLSCADEEREPKPNVIKKIQIQAKHFTMAGEKQVDICFPVVPKSF